MPGVYLGVDCSQDGEAICMAFYHDSTSRKRHTLPGTHRACRAIHSAYFQVPGVQMHDRRLPDCDSKLPLNFEIEFDKIKSQVSGNATLVRVTALMKFMPCRSG